MSDWKTARIPKDIYNSLIEFANELDLTIGQAIMRLLDFYYNYSDKIDLLNAKSEDLTPKSKRCVYGYYGYEEDEKGLRFKTFECPVLKQFPYIDLITLTTKICQKCNRRQIVLKLMEYKLKSKMKEKEYYYPISEGRKKVIDVSKAREMEEQILARFFTYDKKDKTYYCNIDNQGFEDKDLAIRHFMKFHKGMLEELEGW